MSFGRPYACLYTKIYSTSFRKDLHLLLNEKRLVQKINVTLFICGWSTHRQISSERHSSLTWLFACSWHYSSVRVSPPRACGRGCHGYQALCITVMSTDILLKCHWTRNGCCNPSKPHLALDGHCFVLRVISCLCMWCYSFCALSVTPLSLNRCVCVWIVYSILSCLWSGGLWLAHACPLHLIGASITSPHTLSTVFSISCVFSLWSFIDFFTHLCLFILIYYFCLTQRTTTWCAAMLFLY